MRRHQYVCLRTAECSAASQLVFCHRAVRRRTEALSGPAKVVDG
jgi:hypothetical protein